MLKTRSCEEILIHGNLGKKLIRLIIICLKNFIIIKDIYLCLMLYILKCKELFDDISVRKIISMRKYDSQSEFQDLTKTQMVQSLRQ